MINLTHLKVCSTMKYCIILDSTSSALAGETRLYSVSDFQTSLTSAVSGFYNYPSDSFYSASVAQSVPMMISFRNGSSHSYSLTATNPLGPFTDITPVTRQMLNEAVSIALTYELYTIEPTSAGSGQYSALNFTWYCNALYDFTVGGGCIEYSIDISATIVGARASVLERLDVAIIIVSSVSILLTVRSLYRAYIVYRFARLHLSIKPKRRNVSAAPQPAPSTTLHTVVDIAAQSTDPDEGLMWSDMDLLDKLAFFNLWYACRACLVALRRCTLSHTNSAIPTGKSQR
jgi:hypothetical protein